MFYIITQGDGNIPYDLKIDDPNIIENDDFVIFSTHSLKSFSEASFKELTINKERILQYFGLTEFRQICVILFDNILEFRKYVLSLRNEEGSLPEYATGVFDKGMIISYINLERIKDKDSFMDKIKMNVHEFIHIVNKEKNIFKKNCMAG